MPTRRKSHQHQPQRSSKAVRKPRHPATPITSDAPVWGAEQIGLVIGRSARSTYHLLESKSLKGAKKIRGTWSAIPSVLRREWESTDEAGE
jgi:hypothetical protein